MTKTHAAEPAVRELLSAQGIDLAITVPCKYIANLIQQLETDERFEVLYPSREEEGVGIAVGAWLAGRKPIMLVQNSGLGNMVNVYRSLNHFYGIPLCLLISYRGDEHEPVPAQVPMGEVTEEVLATMGLPVTRLESEADVAQLEAGLRRFVEEDQSVAFLSTRPFWTV